MKVYLVERGAYSDRYVAAIYSSRELAEFDIAQHGPPDGWNGEGSIEEYDVDEHAGEVERVRFTTWIDLSDGSIVEREQHKWHATPERRSDPPELKDWRDYSTSMFGTKGGRLMAECHSFVSAEHADKLAAEYRQSHLRTTRG